MAEFLLEINDAGDTLEINDSGDSLLILDDEAVSQVKTGGGSGRIRRLKRDELVTVPVFGALLEQHRLEIKGKLGLIEKLGLEGKINTRQLEEIAGHLSLHESFDMMGKLRIKERKKIKERLNISYYQKILNFIDSL